MEDIGTGESRSRGSGELSRDAFRGHVEGVEPLPAKAGLTSE